ncbi:MAG: hypothetical protein IT221_15475 [Fluviicola sp.]|nr:hypothetical protein [Fluviicola sp.]
MKSRSEEIEVLENKLKVLNDIWVTYFFSYPFFHSKVKFTEEEKTNYIGVIFGYFRDSLDVVFANSIGVEGNYASKFAYHIALLQSIYVQQDLTEELLIIFKTGVDRGTLNKDLNFSENRRIRNELVGHPISRNSDFSLRSSTVFGYESNGNRICYLKYEFPEEKNIVQKVEIEDILVRHINFLNTYLDILLEKSYSMLCKFKSNVLDVLGLHLSKNDTGNIIKFSLIHFEKEFDSQNEIRLSQVEGLANNKSHLRYDYAFKQYLQDVTDFHRDKVRDIDEIVSKKRLLPRTNVKVDRQSIIPKIVFVKGGENDGSHIFERTDYNYEMGKLYSKRNPMDFEHFSQSILLEHADDQSIIDEIEHLRNNLDSTIEYNCSWNYLSGLLETKLCKTA